jgi:hypothetical protein
MRVWRGKNLEGINLLSGMAFLARERERQRKGGVEFALALGRERIAFSPDDARVQSSPGITSGIIIKWYND